MSAYLPIDEHTRLKTYTATTRPGKSVIRIELECSDHNSLGWLLERLEDISKEQKSQTKRTKHALLQIEDMRGNRS